MAAPVAAQPIPASDVDIHGEETGCAAPSLCGDFGSSLASVDLNGDGVLDLVISGPTVSGANPDTGRVYVFVGPLRRNPRADRADFTVTGLQFADLLDVARGGDVNNDGLNDLVIGARGPDVGGGILNGQVWVYISSAPSPGPVTSTATASTTCCSARRAATVLGSPASSRRRGSRST